MKDQTRPVPMPPSKYETEWLRDEMARWSGYLDKRVLLERITYHLLDGETTTEMHEGILVEVLAAGVGTEITRLDLHFADASPVRVSPSEPWRVAGVKSIHWSRYSAHTGGDQRPSSGTKGGGLGSVSQLRPVPTVTADTEEADATAAPPPAQDE